MTSGKELSIRSTEADILWQVQEVNYPMAANCYDAIDLLLFKIQDSLTNPNATPQDNWMFSPKNGENPSIQFLLYQNKQTVRGIVYDRAFFTRVMVVDSGPVVIPMGGTSEAIYRAYYYVKLGDEKKIPPLPKHVASGRISISENEVKLTDVYYGGADARKEYEAAHKHPGFPTEACHALSRLHKWPRYHQEAVIHDLIKKYGMPEWIAPYVLKSIGEGGSR